MLTCSRRVKNVAGTPTNRHMSPYAPPRPSRVVVCAYGPADRTALAVRQARGVVAPGGDVVVIAAHHDVPGRGHGVGTAALDEALAGAGAGPVLFLHDDVTLDRGTVRALARAWEKTGSTAVPWTVAAGTDHHVDADVPVDVAARARLARRLHLPPATAAAIRPCCAFGSPAQLRALANHHIVLGDCVLSRVPMPVAVAAGALAAHDDTCRDSLPRPTGPDGRPLLVATLIVRDEEHLLAACLASLDGLVDRIEVCDTGSTDATIAIAEQHGAHVLQRAWRADFAWARNEVLEQASDAWFVLQIDADERLRCADPAYARRRLAGTCGGGAMFAVPIENLDDAASVESSHHAVRIFDPARARYHGAVHERPLPVNGDNPVAARLDGLALEHLGYAQRHVVATGKGGRNLEIARAAYEAAPGWEAAFQYARSLLAIDEHAERADELLADVVDAGDAVPLPWRAYALGVRARLRLNGDPEGALELAGRALELVPADPLASGVHATAARRLDRPELVLSHRQHRQDAESPIPMVESSTHRSYLAAEEMHTLVDVGQTAAAFDQAIEELTRDPDRFMGWPALVRSVAAADDPAVDRMLAEATLADPSGTCFAAVARQLPPQRTTAICRQYLAAGGRDPRVVRDGLAAAFVARDDELIADLVPAVDLLEPVLGRQLAAIADRYGMPQVAQRLREDLDARLVPFVVCGAGRSGTGYASQAFTALGHPCGHEAVFDPYRHVPDFGMAQGDSSWLSVPFLDDLPDHAVIFHQVRDPVDVLRSLVGIRMLTAPSPYLDFIGVHHPEVLDQPDELSRCIAYWVTWNAEVARHADGARPYVRYRLEDATPALLAQLASLVGGRLDDREAEARLAVVPHRYNARRRDESIVGSSLPAGELTARMWAMAAEFGYQPVPA